MRVSVSIRVSMSMRVGECESVSVRMNECESVDDNGVRVRVNVRVNESG